MCRGEEEFAEGRRRRRRGDKHPSVDTTVAASILRKPDYSMKE